MTRQMEGKVALVTGGTFGIGRASALKFAREGAKVIFSGRRQEGGEETIRLIKEVGSEVIFIKSDISKAAEVEALMNKALESYGRLDYAFNNAGIEGIRTPMIDYTEEDWDRVISINLKGVWLCMKYEIRQMLKQGSGAIVNMSSTFGLVGGRGLSAYVASKHGVVGLTKAAALEYAQMGIRINAVCPGAIRTSMQDRLMGSDPQALAQIAVRYPIGRMGTPEEIAEAVVWLCSDAASFITGEAMVIDGGLLAQ